MTALDLARKEIDRIDKEIAVLFCERMRYAGEIARYKADNGIDLCDSEREAQILEKNALLIPDAELTEYYLEFMKEILSLSKRYQRFLTDGNK